MVRLRGQRHAHYRRLIVQPMKRVNVNRLGTDMGRTTKSVVARWPVEEPLDLWRCVRDLMQTLAIALLFGGDLEKGKPIGNLINQIATLSWSPRVNAFRLDVPGTPFAALLRRAEHLEQSILDWARSKRGPVDPHDLLSIIVNNTDENGLPPDDTLIAGHVPTLLGAAYETCQNVVIWSLLLLAGHPRIAEDLKDELGYNLKGEPASLDELEKLTLLDHVVKESMRILPPVPNQYRVALADTGLGDVTVRKGARAVLSAFALNREPNLYPEPQRFRPNRWETINPSPFEYAAFSAGPRGCPGFYFGISVVKVALATILSTYSIELIRNRSIGYRVGVTLRPFPGVPAVLHPLPNGRPPIPIDGKINRLVQFPS